MAKCMNECKIKTGVDFTRRVDEKVDILWISI